ncbi:Cytochrome P450 [Moelleriella libera RCEF 2490]|uniref:Cytochrome P450 n=1 Tax=Moelleriella libera RCEF 2490 TaxID=1081109 RepID=A0A168EU19_9HYPO|nr:Cytochrome P450 [Moelleriella libera RCEF 2490]
MSAVYLYVLAGIAGAAAHLSVFRVGEWDTASLSICKLHAAALSIASLIVSTLYHVSLLTVAACFGCYVAGLYSSMIIYRSFFHRLHAYPGPFLAKISGFYTTATCTRDLGTFRAVQKLHAQYGDYLRLDPDAVQAIYNAHSPVTNGPFYSSMAPQKSLLMARDKREHARRRKVWDQGFTTKALLGYQGQLARSVNELLVGIEKKRHEPMNMTRWLDLFAFDVMESLAFGKSSHKFRDRAEDAYIFGVLRQVQIGFARFATVPWFLPIWNLVPVLSPHYANFQAWLRTQIQERIENEPEQPDIFSWILDAYKRGPKTQQDTLDLYGDCFLIVIAGSDTTAASLTHTIFHLATNPELVRRLQHELDALPSIAHENLLKVDLIDATLKEALRLHPVVPSGLQRITPPEGLTIGQNHIPGDTIVKVPTHTVLRDARNFEMPNEFIPERWTTRAELVKNHSVFLPFSAGPHACAGQRLAMMEMRSVIAEILCRYNVRLAPGQTEKAFMDGKKDTFTVVPGELHLIFEPRE